MNTKSNAIRILCYGDSNTWGDSPIANAPRYSLDIRWTGRLQKELGEGFKIIEEGLCGRTTVLDDPKEEGRNGKTYLKPCLQTHNPVDLVILMLGTNDLKERFNLSAKEISINIEKLIMIIKKFGVTKDNKQPKIILISPVLVNEHASNPPDGMKGAEEKSKQFARYYQEVANKHGCKFIDLAQYIQPSKIDGCHLDKEAHKKIAEVLSVSLRNHKD